MMSVSRASRSPRPSSSRGPGRRRAKRRRTASSRRPEHGPVPPGPLTLTARATNTAGVSSDAAVTVTVNNALPTIDVTSPSDGTVQGNVVIHAAARRRSASRRSQSTSPARHSSRRATRRRSPTNCDREFDPNTIDILWDTTTATEGPHTITFAATDTSGNSVVRARRRRRRQHPCRRPSPASSRSATRSSAPTSPSFELDADGARGSLIDHATTDDHGRYQIVNPEYEGAIEVVATGGSFTRPRDRTHALVARGPGARRRPLERRPGRRGGRERQRLDDARREPRARDERAVAVRSRRPSTSTRTSSRATCSGRARSRCTSVVVRGPPHADAGAVGLSRDPRARARGALAPRGAGVDRRRRRAGPGHADRRARRTRSATSPTASSTAPTTARRSSSTARHVPMDSYTLRTTLADRIDAFVKNAPLVQNGAAVLAGTRNAASTITSAALSAPGLLYDDLAERSLGRCSRPTFRRVPSITPRRRSRSPSLRRTTPRTTATPSPARSPLPEPRATTSGVCSFDVRAPGVADRRVLERRGSPRRVRRHHRAEPRRRERASAASTSPRRRSRSPDADRQVCVCAEAADSVANVADDALCFTRPRPTITSDAGAFIGPARSTIAVHSVGSFNLAQCDAALDGGRRDARRRRATAATARSATSSSRSATLTSGAASLAVNVTEIGGAVTTRHVPAHGRRQRPDRLDHGAAGRSVPGDAAAR